MPDWAILRPRNDGFNNSPRAARRPPPLIFGDHIPRGKALQVGNFRSEKSLTPIDQLAVFREQTLDAWGDMYFKVSRFQRSRRYYTELRGATIVVYRSPTPVTIQSVTVEEVMTVLPVHEYKMEIISMGDAESARVYITPERVTDPMMMYIKVQGKESVDAWRLVLGRQTSAPIPSLTSLTIESVIGRGGGGKVFVVNWKEDGSTYALKVIDKVHTFRSGKGFLHVASERMLMEKVGRHPFLLPLQFAFQSNANLFIGTPFCRGGDLASYMRHKGDRSLPRDDFLSIHVQAGHRKMYGRLSEDQTRKVAAEIILGLEHLHRQGIVYRDLKPENILIGGDGHIMIGDYGLAKQLIVDDNEDNTTRQRAADGDSEITSTGSTSANAPHFDGRQQTNNTNNNQNSNQPRLCRTMSICGTRNYLPPEMLSGRMYSFEADVWSLGIMIYRMVCGVFPFDGRRTKEVFQRIKKERLRIPGWVSPSTRDLLRGLLEKRPERRFSLNDAKHAEFFATVNWNEVLEKRSPAPIADMTTGPSLQDALENFELSKLQGITMGEYVSESYDLLSTSPISGGNPLNFRALGNGGNTGGRRSGGKATHRKNPRSMMIGFDYSRVTNENQDAQPLTIRQKSSGFTGLMSKLSSVEMEQQLPLSPRTPFHGPGK